MENNYKEYIESFAWKAIKKMRIRRTAQIVNVVENQQLQFIICLMKEDEVKEMMILVFVKDVIMNVIL